MRQSAVHTRKTPPHINAFWEKWTQQWKLALLAKEGIQLEILLNGPPTVVFYPPEPVYEEPVENYTQATERDRKIRNQQVKVTWQSRCREIDEMGILCGDKPWVICEQRATYLLYLCTGTKDCRIFKCTHFSS